MAFLCNAGRRIVSVYPRFNYSRYKWSSAAERSDRQPNLKLKLNASSASLPSLWFHCIRIPVKKVFTEFWTHASLPLDCILQSMSCGFHVRYCLEYVTHPRADPRHRALEWTHGISSLGPRNILAQSGGYNQFLQI